MADRQRSSEDIRAEIERTRADMDETVQQIGYKLSPGQIVDQVWDRMRTGDAAGSMMEVVKQHPMPSLLMGLGLGWLVYEKTGMSEGEKLRRKYGDDIGPGTYAPAEGRVGPYRGEELGYGTDDGGVGERLHGALDSARETASGAADKVGDAAASVKSGVSSAASSVRDGLRSVAEKTGERAHHLRERADEVRGRAGERASELSSRARQGVTHAYDEQPLALGAVAFGLGLASGLVAPSTRFEDEALGERADRFKGEVRRTGSELYESARRVADEATHAAKDSFTRQGVVDELKTRARAVAEEAKLAARNAIERDGVAETLKNRVRAIATDTRDAARDAAERERIDPAGLQERARESADRIRE